MTIPIERTNAVIHTENFLYNLIDPKKTPRVPKAIREQARHLLRHYPNRYQMEIIAEQQDKNLDPLDIKVFGKSFYY